MTGQAPAYRQAILETRFGPVAIHVFDWRDEQPYAVLRNLSSDPAVILRLQAQCVTSTAFSAKMCDCREQIDAGVRLAATRPGGTLVYLPQEGRGYGLLSKVEIMEQMNQGLTLAESQAAVGRPEDRLAYHRIAEILAHLGLSEPAVLVTESAHKIAAVTAAGVNFTAVEPLAV